MSGDLTTYGALERLTKMNEDDNAGGDRIGGQFYYDAYITGGEIAGVVLVPGSLTVQDNTFTIQDNLDNTKQAQFQCSGISTGTTRTFTFPDADTTLVGTDATQPLTNKTIDASTIGATTAATGRFTTVESTVATGTAPLIVASTTRVNNLNVAQSGVADTVTVADAAGDTTTFPMLAGSATGNLPVLTDAGLTYDASTNNLSTTTFTGALSGNATTATTATNASNVALANDAADTTNFVTFANDATGNQALKTNTNLTFNASTAQLGASSVAITGSAGAVFTGQAAPAYAQGKLVYDTDNECLNFYNNDSSVALNIGQESWIRVRNDTGSTIANGAAVYISGTHASGLPQVTLAQANASTTTVVAGLATEAIPNNSIGYITSLGLVRNLDTSALTVGNVFLSATTPGGLTNTAPTSPNFRYRVGFVTRVNATNGTIHVTPTTAALGNGTANQILAINSAGTAQSFTSTPIATNYTVNGSTIPANGLYLPAANAPAIAANTLPVTQFQSSGTAINRWNMTSTPTGVAPLLSVVGGDTNVSQQFATAGTGGYFFLTNAGAQTQFRIDHTASSVNYVTATGAATGSSPSLTVANGSDTNINFVTVAKGTGVLVNLGSYTNVAGAANVSIAATGAITRVSSQEKYKPVIEDADIDRALNVYDNLSVKWFRMNSYGCRKDWGFYGPTAEGIAAVEPALAIWDREAVLLSDEDGKPILDADGYVQNKLDENGMPVVSDDIVPTSPNYGATSMLLHVAYKHKIDSLEQRVAQLEQLLKAQQ